MGRWDAVWLLLPLLGHAAPEVYGGGLGGLDSMAAARFRPGKARRSPGRWWPGRGANTTLVGVAKRVLTGPAEALPGLRELADRTPLVRAAALSLLDPHHVTDAGTPHVLPLFVRHLDDVSTGVRQVAAEAAARSARRPELAGEVTVKDVAAERNEFAGPSPPMATPASEGSTACRTPGSTGTTWAPNESRMSPPPPSATAPRACRSTSSPPRPVLFGPPSPPSPRAASTTAVRPGRNSPSPSSAASPSP